MFRQIGLLVLIPLTMVTFYPQKSDAQRKLTVDEVFTEVAPNSDPTILEKDDYTDLTMEEKNQAHPNKEHQKLNLAEGWLVKMYSAPEDLKTIPNTEMASFVSKKSPYTLIDHRKNKELEFFKEPTAYLYEGYFNVDKAGYYTFFANITMPNIKGSGLPKCRYSFWIEDYKLIDSGELRMPLTEDKEFSKGESHSLEQGTYKVKQWLACDKYLPTELYLRVKRPDESLPTIANPTDFTHEPR